MSQRIENTPQDAPPEYRRLIARMQTGNPPPPDECRRVLKAAGKSEIDLRRDLDSATTPPPPNWSPFALAVAAVADDVAIVAAG